MTSNNHKNSGCGFSDQMVSYLYGESGAAEISAVEAHLQTCSACGEELEAFSGLHFSITEWKLQDFANLATPVIEIPYEQIGQTSIRQEAPGLKSSWFSGLRNLFSLPLRPWSLATASLAVLAVFVGIALIALYSGKENDIAGGTNKNSKPSAAPTFEKTPEQTNTNQNILPEKERKPLDMSKSPRSEVAAGPETKNKRIVKTSNDPRPASKAETSTLPKNNKLKPGNKNNKQTEPKIIGDEEEDDSLRLAELFEEIDTKE